MIEKVTFRIECQLFVRVIHKIMYDTCDRSDEWLALVRQLHNLL